MKLYCGKQLLWCLDRVSKGPLRVRAWKIDGQVQGVGFRFFVQHKAVALGITGWAKNLDNGSVEVVGFGLPERLEDLGAALYIGPSGAVVRNVSNEEVSQEMERTATAMSGFSIR